MADFYSKLVGLGYADGYVSQLAAGMFFKDGAKISSMTVVAEFLTEKEYNKYMSLLGSDTVLLEDVDFENQEMRDYMLATLPTHTAIYVKGSGKIELQSPETF
jgi:hypothetical protein